MIFYLKCTIEQLSKTGQRELEDVVSALVDADRFGRHFFIAERSICRWAVENLRLSHQNRAHLQSIQEEFAIRSGLFRVSSTYVTIEIGNAPVSLGNTSGFRIGHETLLGGQYLATSTSLVLEDLITDGGLYEIIVNEAKKVHDVPSCSFDPIHGGGERTLDVFKAEIEKQRVVICIVDRDSVAPMAPKSNVAEKVIKEHVRRNVDKFSAAAAYIGLGATTVGRELENHIPYHLIRLMPQHRHYPDSREMDRIVRQKEKTSADECFWQFFDVKKGLSGRKIKEDVESGTLSPMVMQWMCEQIGCDPAEMEGITLKGFGERVIHTFADNNEALSGFHEFVRSKYWSDVYGEFFEAVLWYFAAPRLVRT